MLNLSSVELAALRAQAYELLVDTGVSRTRIGAGATSNSRGGISQSSGSRVAGFVEGVTFKCRYNYSQTIAGGMEMTVADQMTETSSGLLSTEYDVDLRPGDVIDITTSEDAEYTVEIRERLNQSEQITAKYLTRRIR